MELATALVVPLWIWAVDGLSTVTTEVNVTPGAEDLIVTAEAEELSMGALVRNVVPAEELSMEVTVVRVTRREEPLVTAEDELATGTVVNVALGAEAVVVTAVVEVTTTVMVVYATHEVGALATEVNVTPGEEVATVTTEELSIGEALVATEVKVTPWAEVLAVTTEAEAELSTVATELNVTAVAELSMVATELNVTAVAELSMGPAEDWIVTTEADVIPTGAMGLVIGAPKEMPELTVGKSSVVAGAVASDD